MATCLMAASCLAAPALQIRTPLGRFSVVTISPKRPFSGRTMVRATAATQRASFQSSVNTDLVLHEYKTVPFERYMEDEDRIFDALFPDSRRRQKLNDDEWRIFMLPLDFFFVSVRPVVDMRVSLKEAPKGGAGTTQTVTRLLTLEATRWELRGLDYSVKPSEFSLGIAGFLFPERVGSSPPRLKGQMKLSVDLSIPPSLGLIPSAVIESFGKALLSQLLETMKERVNTRLLQDYREYAQQQMQARLTSA